MKHPLYLVEQGSKVGRHGQQLVISRDGEELSRIATLQVSQVVVMGNIQLTTPAMQLLLGQGTEVVFLSQSGRFYGRLVGESSGHSALRVAQVIASRQAPFALGTARRIVRGKLHNMRVFLLRYGRRRDEPSLADAAARIGTLLERIESANDTAALMGVEGQATAVYFSAWRALLKAPWTFERRVRRPPTDPVNALISFAYTLLLQNVMGAVQAVGLDPYVGFLHQLEYNRPSLALDMVEEFRPIVADSVALRCLNNAILTETHFATGEAARPVLLTPDGVRLFVREFERRLTDKFTDPRTGRRVHYRRLFMLQAYDLARSIKSVGETGPDGADSAFYRPFLVR